MSIKSTEISVFGIMIGAEYKDYKLYLNNTIEEEHDIDGTYRKSGSSSEKWVEGLNAIVKYLNSSPLCSEKTRFLVIYDVSCPNKEKHLKSSLNMITHIASAKKNDLLPILISIGHEQSQLDKEITDQVGIIKEIEATDTLDNLLFDSVNIEVRTFFEVKKQNESLETMKEIETADVPENLLLNSANAKSNNNKETLLAPEKQDGTSKTLKDQSIQQETSPAIATSNITMTILTGFIAATGIAAVAIAFALLSGVAAVAVAGYGIAAALVGGIGFFLNVRDKEPANVFNGALEQSEILAPC